MIILLYTIAGYLVVGLLFLILFNSRTRRIKGNLDDVVTDAQAKIANTSITFNAIAGPAGQMPPLVMGRRLLVIILLITSWMVWPLVLAGYFKDRRGDKNAERI